VLISRIFGLFYANYLSKHQDFCFYFGKLEFPN